MRADGDAHGDENENVAAVAFVRLVAAAGSGGTKACVMLEPMQPAPRATGLAAVAAARLLAEIGVIVATTTGYSSSDVDNDSDGDGGAKVCNW